MTTSEVTGQISNIQNFCLHDGEGIRTTVFFAGCPLRCRWCANPETWDTAAAVTRTPAEITARCSRDRIFYRHSGGGVTLSGGEPTMQPTFLNALVSSLADEGLDLAMETSGWFDLQLVEPSLRRIDLLFIDLKHMDPSRHRQLTGRDNSRILANIKTIGAMGKEIVIRMVLVPEVNDQPDNLSAAAAFVCAHVPGKRIELLPCHDWGQSKYQRLGLSWPGYRPPTAEELLAAKKLIGDCGATVVDFS